MPTTRSHTPSARRRTRLRTLRRLLELALLGALMSVVAFAVERRLGRLVQAPPAGRPPRSGLGRPRLAPA